MNFSQPVTVSTRETTSYCHCHCGHLLCWMHQECHSIKSLIAYPVYPIFKRNVILFHRFLISSYHTWSYCQFILLAVITHDSLSAIFLILHSWLTCFFISYTFGWLKTQSLWQNRFYASNLSCSRAPRYETVGVLQGRLHGNLVTDPSVWYRVEDYRTHLL